jgi:coenzyme F420-reducing hydrogenase delta subunit
MRKQYPTNIRIVRLPCTGKVDENMVLRAFVEGADGVMVAGCEIGSCHFIQGNVRAAKRVARAKKLLAETGVNTDRLEFYYIAASQGPLFASTSAEFTERIKRIDAGKAPADAKSAETPRETINDSSRT